MSTRVSLWISEGPSCASKRSRLHGTYQNAKRRAKYTDLCDAKIDAFLVLIKTPNWILWAWFNWTTTHTSADEAEFSGHAPFDCLSLCWSKKSIKMRQQRRLVCRGKGQECVRIPAVTPALPVLSRFWRNLGWRGCFSFFFFVFSPTLPAERSQPIENNKVRNLTLMKEMRERKQGPWAHLCEGGKGRKGRMKNGKQTLCALSG